MPTPYVVVCPHCGRRVRFVKHLNRRAKHRVRRVEPDKAPPPWCTGARR